MHFTNMAHEQEFELRFDGSQSPGMSGGAAINGNGKVSDLYITINVLFSCLSRVPWSRTGHNQRHPRQQVPHHRPFQHVPILH
jgi:hypothetical protein